MITKNTNKEILPDLLLGLWSEIEKSWVVAFVNVFDRE